MKKRKRSLSDSIFIIVVYALLIAFTLVCFLPIWHLLMASFSNSSGIARTEGLMFWPQMFDLGAYKLVFQDKSLMGGFKNTLLYLGGALPLNLLLTLMAGYFLSCTNMVWKNLIARVILFTMFFSGGMIPTYLNIRDLNLLDSLWALILSGTISVTNALICKTSIEAIPDSLRESAYLDGANDFQIIFKIILPLIKATIAVLTLYYGVGHWNNWFHASIYISSPDKLPVQNILRAILIENELGEMDADMYNAYAETIKYGAIVVSTAPIMCIYPFLQKYFAKGALIGAVKG